MARRSVLLLVAVAHRPGRHRPDRALRPGHRRPRHRGPGARRGAGRHRDDRHRRDRRRRPGGRQVREEARSAARTWSTAASPRPASIADLVAIGTIYPGEQLIAKKFGTLGDTESLVIPDDKMAVSVELTDFERVAGFVNPGNEVAIFATARPDRLAARRQGAEARRYTRIVLTRVPVLGVGTTSVTSRTTTDEDGDAGRRGGARRPSSRSRVDPGGGREADPRRPHGRAQLRAADRRVQGRATSRASTLGDVLPELFRGVQP